MENRRFIPFVAQGTNGMVAKYFSKNACIIIKIRRPEGDLLLQDALVMKLIESSPLTNVDKSYFLSSYDQKYLVDYGKRNIHICSESNVPGLNITAFCSAVGGENDRNVDYALLTYGVKSPMNLMSSVSASNDTPSVSVVMTSLCAFLTQCLNLARQTGFSHGDFHVGNILLDKDIGKFVLIDYGRSYIHKNYQEFLNHYDIMDHLNTMLELNDKTFPSIHTRAACTDIDPKVDYINDPNYTNNADLNSFMMTIDIAGLCFYLCYNKSKQVCLYYEQVHSFPISKHFHIAESRSRTKHLTFKLDELIALQPMDAFVAGLRQFCLLCHLLKMTRELNVLDKNGNVTGEQVYAISIPSIYNQGPFHGPSGVMYPHIARASLRLFKEHPLKSYYFNPMQPPQQIGGDNASIILEKIHAEYIQSLNGQDPWERVFEEKERIQNRSIVNSVDFDVNTETSSLAKRATSYLPAAPMIYAQAGGRSNNTRQIQLHKRSKPSRVYIDANKKAFIRLNNQKVYLSEIRGQYKNIKH